MTFMDEHVVNTIEAIADNVPLHADELRACSRRVKAALDELDFVRAQLRDAALLIQSQRDELDALKSIGRVEVPPAA